MSNVTMAGLRLKGAAHSPWVDRLARAGLAAKGALYVIVGVLAAQIALGTSGQSASQQGAIRSLAGQPFGTVLLVVLAIGLAGYTLWRLAQAVIGPDEEGAKAVVLRVSFLVRALIYGALCVFTVRILGSGGSSSGGGQTQDTLTARLLGLPFGVPLVVAVGLVIIGIGLYQGYTGLSHDFTEDYDTSRMSANQRRWATRVGVAGHLSRMVVFGLAGLFLVRAALTFDPQQAVGLDGALREIAAAPYGTVLLLVVALGLACYGAYCFVLARWGRTRDID